MVQIHLPRPIILDTTYDTQKSERPLGARPGGQRSNFIAPTTPIVAGVEG